MKKQKIKCDVKNCIYQNNNKNRCILEEIKVSSNSEYDNIIKTQEETICTNFKSDKDK